jgi:hypothetical protein
MTETFDWKEVEAAFQRAAWKAVHGTRAEKAGRFTDEPLALAVKDRPPAAFAADKQNR